MLARGLAFSSLAVLCFACGSGAANDDIGDGVANLDTSGCSGFDRLDRSEASGPIEMRAARPPRRSCWNVPTSGLTASYAWGQTNDPTPQAHDIGFWVSLNGEDAYAKASAYRCDEVPGGGFGHATSGDRAYRCTATLRFDFEKFPRLLHSAYAADGSRLGWEVQVAVSLDDQGTWDSLQGRNYRFSL